MCHEVIFGQKIYAYHKPDAVVFQWFSGFSHLPISFFECLRHSTCPQKGHFIAPKMFHWKHSEKISKGSNSTKRKVVENKLYSEMWLHKKWHVYKTDMLPMCVCDTCWLQWQQILLTFLFSYPCSDNTSKSESWVCANSLRGFHRCHWRHNLKIVQVWLI